MPDVIFPVTRPLLDEEDRRTLLDAFDSGWISSQGPYLGLFERSFAEYTGTRHALATCNGTTALHLSLLALECGPGDEVIVPTFTYVATANAVRYCGATPIFVDCDPDTWTMDPTSFAKAISPHTKGVIPVHLYGHPCDMEPILAIARQHKLWVVEDAAEAHGALYHGRRVGSLGDIGVFSLYGNKIITTGEGGILTTSSDALAERISLFRGQGQDPNRRYWFQVVGHNYRMTNLAAALGTSQLKKLDSLIAAHRTIAQWYAEELQTSTGLVLPVERSDSRSVNWLACIRLSAAEQHPRLRDELMGRLAEDGIETRPFFYPMHTMPVHRDERSYPVAERIAASGLNLPSAPDLRRHDVAWIASRVRQYAQELTVEARLLDVRERAASEQQAEVAFEPAQ